MTHLLPARKFLNRAKIEQISPLLQYQSMAAAAMNAIQLSENLLRHEQDDNLTLVRNQNSSETVRGSSSNLELKKGTTLQGRRRT